MTTTQHHPRIAVVGAGPAGLVCARILQRGGVPLTVFEREDSPDARTQGGNLDLHPDTGQESLRRAGLLVGFDELASREAQEVRAVDHATGAVIHRELPGPDSLDAPEIDRGRLRRLLLDSLTPGTVHWGRGVDGVTPFDAGARVSFADGNTHEADLVVGADGAWSRTRPAVSAIRPEYTGTTYVETHVRDVDARHPTLAAMIGPGTMVAEHGELTMFVQRGDHGDVRLFAALETAPDWAAAAGVDLADTEAVRAHLVALFHGWSDELLDLLRAGDRFVDRPIHTQPVEHAWSHRRGITLLGDAAHLMPPYGIGANLAMLDGAELAEAIVAAVDAGTELDRAVRSYESRMLARSTAAARAAVEMEQTMNDDAVVDTDAVRKELNQRMLQPQDA